MRPFLLATLLVCACSGGDPGQGATGGGSASGTGGGTSGTGGSTSGTGGGTVAVENCLGKSLLDSLGKNRLMVGMATSTETVVGQAPWDVRYQYITAGVPDGNGTCSSCASGCTSAGASCAGGACGWWGCWQSDQDPPGAYLRAFIANAKAKNIIPMITYYEQLYSSGAAEGQPQIMKMKETAIMTRFFGDYRFMLQQIGQNKALLHLEPDTWAYAQIANSNPHLVEVAVASANATDCASMENSFAGFGKCTIAMARKYAPNAKIGFHASGWATSMDIGGNTNPNLDVVAESKKTANFLKECGAADTDFVVVEASDRDAGFYASMGRTNAFWDTTNATLPNFSQAFLAAKTVAETVGRPLIWWQLPVGNMSLPNMINKWKDNRVDYFFAHADEVAATHAVLMAFGAGEGRQTDPSTDNGNLIAKTQAYVTAGGQAMTCP